MEDVWLVKQGWVWLHSQKHVFLRVRVGIGCARARVWVDRDRFWPMVCCGCKKFGEFVGLVLSYLRVCYVTGFGSLVGLGSAALLFIMWSCFLSLTSISCLVYVLISMGVAGATITYLGYTPGLFIVGLFAILILWKYANVLIMGLLFIIGGYLFSLKHARLMVFMATVYSLYCVKVRAGWLGVFLSINLAFLSNHALNYLLQWCDNLNESTRNEEYKPSESFTADDFPGECEFSTLSSEESKKTQPCKPSKKTAANAAVKNMKTPKENMKNPKESMKTPKENIKTPKGNIKSQKAASSSQVVKEDKSSLIEMQRILASVHHYDALGFPRHKKIDGALLKKEYHKKAMLVHPDKNLGIPLASESFKKLHCAYEVLSDSLTKRDYDEQLRKEELKNNTLKSSSTSNQDNRELYAEESRRIQCSKCGNSHVWVCTNRSKIKARWCQDCCQYHQAKDGDGWVEYKGSLVFDGPQKVEIPRAFVCAESKIFDVSEWAICQGMACRPNTHRPSFRVNMVGLEKTTRSNSSRFPWDLDAEMLDEDEDFELWLQQALASGLFTETSARRKTWSPFKLAQKRKQWRRSSSGFT